MLNATSKTNGLRRTSSDDGSQLAALSRSFRIFTKQMVDVSRETLDGLRPVMQRPTKAEPKSR